ncbi:hypothetical protein, partial [Klebsiella pneumoniae]|uniref:hypothetical protein n=1 Tax=Klebsiella pneumoniae TaxID=573 RepID=UPI0039B526B9
ADRNRSHWSTSKTPSYTKSVSWQHHLQGHDKSWPFYLSLSRANDKNLLIKNSRPVFGCGK